MKIIRFWITVFLAIIMLFCVMPNCSSEGAFNFSIPTQQVNCNTTSDSCPYSIIESSLYSIDYSSLSENELLSETLYSLTSLEFQPLKIPIIPFVSNAISFRNKLQYSPIYWLIKDFIFLEIIIFTEDSYQPDLSLSAWFLSSYPNSRNRISGWKESNLLYKANITYH